MSVVAITEGIRTYLVDEALIAYQNYKPVNAAILNNSEWGVFVKRIQPFNVRVKAAVAPLVQSLKERLPFTGNGIDRTERS